MSILRYPGGKAKASKRIIQYFPAGLEVMASPFFGGGSVELACAANGVRVHGSDVFDPLTNFWRALLRNADKLADAVDALRPVTYDDFYRMRKEFAEYDPPKQAAVYFAMNRVSFSGITFRGYSGNELLTDGVIDKLRQFRAPNLYIETADYRDTLAKHSDKFCYLDPPYPNSDNLYGYQKGALHTDFDHEALADALRHHNNWIMSNCDTPYIRELYAEYDLIPLSWKYCAAWNGARRDGAELLIRNCAAPPIQPELFASQIAD